MPQVWWLAVLILLLPAFFNMQPHLGRRLLRTLGLDAGPALPGGAQDASAMPVGRVADEIRLFHPCRGTYPRLASLQDGSILCGLTRFEHAGGGSTPERVLTVYRSIDGGATFEPWGEIARSRGDCDNLFLLEIPHSNPPDFPTRGTTTTTTTTITTTILAAFRNHDLDPHRGTPTHFRITVCASHDRGRTWAFLSQAVEHPASSSSSSSSSSNDGPGGGLWEPFLRLGTRRPHELQLYYSHERAPDDQDTMLVRSSDGGATWSPPQVVTGRDLRLRDGMVGVARTRDVGRGGVDVLVMVFETTRHGPHFSIEAVVSYDDGLTWGHRQEVYAPRVRGRNAGAPQVEAFADGSLVVVFMTDEDEHGHEHEDGKRTWPGDAAVKAVFGAPPSQGRIRWHEGVHTVHEPVCAWPGVLRIDDRSVLAVFEHRGMAHGRLLTWGT